MEAAIEPGAEFAWHPRGEDIEKANLTSFMRRNGIENFDTLLTRSTQDIAWFTDALLRYLDIRFYTPYSQVVDLTKGIAWPRWCVGGEMNIVHNCLDKYLGTPVEQRHALVFENENGHIKRLTYAELAQQVNQAANALRSLGLGVGDAVGLFMPMIPEIVVAFLAIAKIGGIILPLFSGYGSGAVASRLEDAGVKALITADGFTRRGKLVPMKPTADEAVDRVPSVKHVIVVENTNTPTAFQPGRDHSWRELVETQSKQAETQVTSAETTLMILYTSGTTGKPKGAVHTHCGFPVKAAQDMAFGTDLHPGETIYWMTDMGWMMGPWLVFGSLLLKGTLLLYDGAPDYPDSGRVWSLVERHKVNKLGISPTLIRALATLNSEPHEKYDISSLHLFASTGEPWNPDPWNWLFDKVGKKQLPIINYSGGTECSGGIVMGNPLLPVKPCAFPAPCPGMAADVLDENGQPARGQVGELVVKAPWIGMTRGFWKDPQRYEETYWSRWPNVWVHGDFAMIDSDGQWFILGRSDDTIKVAGKRLGPAEIESLLVAHPAVVEAAAIGVPDPIKGSQVVVFCVLKPGQAASAELQQELRQKVVASLGKPLAPKEVLFIPDLPKTRNAKVMRRMIRAAYLGQDPGDTSSLVNPEVVAAIQKMRH